MKACKMQYKISKKGKDLLGVIDLERSKSISNRVLIIKALTKGDIPIKALSKSDDTNTLLSLLSDENHVLDVGAAGTTMRFLTAFMAICNGRETIITGSQRMQQRPIGILVDALRGLGADITYLKNEGYPPLKIIGKSLSKNKVSIKGDVSSQFITALLLIGPVLENGLELEIKGELVSIPYIKMTLNIMAYFGISYTWEANTICIQPQSYCQKPYTVEADWSAASYWYEMAALAQGEVHLTIKGLSKDSLQGDAVIANWMRKFGVNTVFEQDQVLITRTENKLTGQDLNFVNCPDIAQSLTCMYAGLGMQGEFRGLKTLKIKETDRCLALHNELKKLGYCVNIKDTDVTYNHGQILNKLVEIDTYEDHRMAMSFAPLAYRLDSILINDPMVVTKSYPMYWEDLKSVGFEVELVP